MCDPATALSAVAGGTNMGAAVFGANAQSKAAQAQADANFQAMQAQNAGFFARNQAAQQALAATSQAQRTAQDATNASFADMRSQQAAALDSRASTLADENTQADAIRQGADAQQAQLLNNTSGQNLAASQAADYANRVAGMAPAADNITTAAPLQAGGADTKQAYAGRLAEAAANVRSYGQKLAQVASYTAPLTTVGQSITQEQGGIMPLAQANQLLQSGQTTRLLPSETAYQIAGSENQAKQAAIGSDLQGAKNVITAAQSGADSVADLSQQGTTQLAANKATQAGMEAAAKSQLAALIGQAGNMASYGSQRYAGSINGAFGAGAA